VREFARQPPGTPHRMGASWVTAAWTRRPLRHRARAPQVFERTWPRNGIRSGDDRQRTRCDREHVLGGAPNEIAVHVDRQLTVVERTDAEPLLSCERTESAGDPRSSPARTAARHAIEGMSSGLVRFRITPARSPLCNETPSAFRRYAAEEGVGRGRSGPARSPPSSRSVGAAPLPDPSSAAKRGGFTR